MCSVCLFVVFNTYMYILCRSLFFVKVEKMQSQSENTEMARRLMREMKDSHSKHKITEKEFNEMTYNPVYGILQQIENSEVDEVEKLLQQKHRTSATVLVAILASYVLFKFLASFVLDKLVMSFPFIYDKVVITSKFSKSFTMFSKSLMIF
jgi:hypothetical protein